ncbi:MAG: DUF4832 domain-containing protein [Anaerolineae bacterium]|jgi:hypothetical protein|nr:DUF4832 domain-containing protein [Anaerolineae bacterium]
MRRFFIGFILILFFTRVYAQDTQIIQYTPSDENFTNPERGFYHQDAPLWLELERVPQNADELRALRADGVSMVRYYFLIDEFRDAPIDEETITYIQAQFDAVREAGFKMIPRFAYNFPTGGEYPYQDPDASLEWVLTHLEQLTPILQNNGDVIAFMEIGLVGAWGEWHSSTNNLVDEQTGINANSEAIITALLEALPQTRMIAMRYPPYKQQLYGDAPLTPEQAFSGTPQARMGAHNDCFLASNTDWGTYYEDETTRQAQKAYLRIDNQYLPQGGETCNDAEDAQPYIHCENALTELAYLRYSTLNRDYQEGVLGLWEAEGCYDDIAKRLGYRFTLIQSEIPTQARAGETISINLTLKNDGFATPYNPRGFEIVLRSTRDGKIWYYESEQDPRRWLPDLGDIQLPITIQLGDDLPAGEYEILINLPDPMPSLYGNPDYSIRFANDGVWEAETGFNNLLATLVIQ